MWRVTYRAPTVLPPSIISKVNAYWDRNSTQDRKQSRNITKNWSLEPRTGSRRLTTPRRQLRTEDQTKDRFEAINGNSIPRRKVYPGN